MQSKGRYRLTVRQGPSPGKVYELAKDVNTLGRDVRNDLVVNDAEVSRSHVRLAEQAGGYLVEDLASTNGTFVNGQRLTAPKLLRPGDLLGLGETVVLEFGFASDTEATLVGSQPPVIVESSPLSSSAAAPGQPAEGMAAVATGEPAPEPKKKRGWLFWTAIGCGCLTALVCLIGLIALGVYLWNAPVEFWRSIGLG